MHWGKILLIVSAMLEVAAIGYAFAVSRMYGRRRIFTPRVILLGGTFVAAFVMFCGLELLAGTEWDGLMKGIMALHNSIRLFVVDISPAEFLYDARDGMAAGTLVDLTGNTLLRGFAGIMFIIAPCLTFDLVLSFFGNTYARLRLWLSRFRGKYVFSELNEKSIALAESLHEMEQRQKGRPRRMIVFGKVSDEVDGQLVERARLLNAVMFREGIESVGYQAINNELAFFAIGQNHEDNVKTAAQIRERYGDREKTRLYIFSSSIAAEMFAYERMDELIEIRRINEARSLVYRTLYDMERERIDRGTPDLFVRAAADGEGKKISAVLVGMGSYGVEMLMALTWFCQMDGYSVKIDAFDTEESAESQLYARCPELMKKSGAGGDNPGDAQYEIFVHSNTDVESAGFVEQIGGLKNTTYVFVALGSDDANISAAVRVRRLLEQKGQHPLIHAVIYNSDKAQILQKNGTARRIAYDIQSVGDLKNLYSERVIINSELEEEARKIHLKYGRGEDAESLQDSDKEQVRSRMEKEFYAYEYFYRSSMASALHLKARTACGLQGKDVSEDVMKLSRLEHRRWNSYMRTEGYSFSGSLDAASRDDLGKLHNLMVPFDELPEVEQKKDRRISL